MRLTIICETFPHMGFTQRKIRVIWRETLSFFSLSLTTSHEQCGKHRRPDVIDMSPIHSYALESHAKNEAYRLYARSTSLGVVTSALSRRLVRRIAVASLHMHTFRFSGLFVLPYVLYRTDL
ncbi:hypothetical protein HJC23_012203 [Cyclotella cryptica]|uniref:Uncharacterized protein n=1 Tax=Cyclotella cryptica TaxID=29204 RepID=A0ABD3PUQ9_9STRA